MNNFEFRNATELIFGEGQLAKLGEKTIQFGKKVLLVYGGGSIKKSGLYDKVMDQLKAAGCTVFELAGVEPNPRVTTVQKGADLCKKEGIDLVLAVGGGSVLDASKAVAVGAKYDGNVWDLVLNPSKISAALPLGTVLTLAATGSEMNRGSVITNWEINEKRGFGAPVMSPQFSILDPGHTFSVPRDQTTYGIVDMMSHAFENYFSHTQNVPLQERLIESVLLTVIENAPKVLANPEDYEARANIMLCGTMALNGMTNMGMQGDWACHGMEHVISAHYDIPHAGGLAILFPNWMKHVLDEGVEKFKQFAIRVWKVDPAGKSDREVALEGIAKVRQFFDSIEAPKTLADYGIGAEKIDLMASQAVERPLGGFKKLTKEDVKTIYEMSL